MSYLFFFFNDTATTEIYTLSLHDALPISLLSTFVSLVIGTIAAYALARLKFFAVGTFGTGIFVTYLVPTSLLFLPLARSEEHTSELQSQSNLVCRLLLEKKKSISSYQTYT